jgi:hypothetical protein
MQAPMIGVYQKARRAWQAGESQLLPLSWSKRVREVEV